MRIVVGILMIIMGICGLSIPGFLTEQFTKVMGVETAFEMTQGITWLSLLLLGLTIGGGISTFIKKHWWWAFSGAICSMFIAFAMLIYPVFGLIFPPMAILVLIFLIKRKHEFE